MALSRALNEFIAEVLNEVTNEKNDPKKYLTIIFAVLTVLAIAKFLERKEKSIQLIRDAEGFTQEDRLKQEKVWNIYALSKLMGMAISDSQTELFFKAISDKHVKEFKSSTSQIIQFGISTGDVITRIAKEKHRKVIGYDYSQVALASLKEEKEVETRLVNLNAVEKNELLYQEQLQIDFERISDVLFIRVLEYLNPEAAKLVIISTMNLAKPGSRFYFEVDSPPRDKITPAGITVVYALKPGTISSIFAKRGDLQIEVLTDKKNENDKGTNTIERLLIKKIG